MISINHPNVKAVIGNDQVLDVRWNESQGCLYVGTYDDGEDPDYYLYRFCHLLEQDRRMLKQSDMIGCTVEINGLPAHEFILALMEKFV